MHHFPSKERLLREVLTERDRSDGKRFDLALHGGNRDLLNSLRKLVEYDETVPGLVRLFARMDGLQVQWALEGAQIDTARIFERFPTLVKSK